MLDDSFLRQRVKDAKKKAAFFAGKTDEHPQGLSGKLWLLPPENDKRNRGDIFEWGVLGGFPDA